MRFPKIDTTVVLVLAAVLLAITPVSIDSSGWSQLRFGQDALDQHTVLLANTYSYVPMRETWLNSHWLGSQLLAYLRSHLGWVGTALAVAGNALVVLALVFAPGMSRGACALATVAVGVLLFALLGRTELGSLSAVLPSYLPFTLAILLFAGCRAGQMPAWCVLLLPPVFAFWINVDQSAVWGLILLAVACLDCWLNAGGAATAAGVPAQGGAGTARVWRAPVRLALFTTLALALSLLACCATPFGSGLLQAGWNELLSPPPLPEWHALHAASNLGMTYLALAALAFWSGGVRLPSFILFLSPYYALRFLPYAALGLALAVMRNPQPKLSRLEAIERFQQKTSTQIICAVVSAVLFCFTAARAAQMDPADSAASMPEGAVAFILKNNLSGNLAVGGISNWGDYCLYRLYPRIRVSIDTRWNHAYEPTALDEYLSFRWGLFPWDATITRRPTNLVLAGKDTAIFNLMKLTPGWKLAFEDSRSGLFVKSK